MKKIRLITCIVCPVGCKAKVTAKNKRISKIEGVDCPQGEEYVKQEFETPVRDFFTTIRIKGAHIPVLPVRSSQPVPKDRIMNYVLELAKIVVEAPVKEGDVVASCDLGIDFISTRSLNRTKGT